MDANKTNANAPGLNVLLIGGGVIGGVYGAQLSLAGHTLWILAHGTEPATKDIQVHNMATSKTEVAKAAVARNADEREYDLVIVAVRSDQLASTFPALHTLKGRPHILFLGNNPDGHKALPADLPGTVQLGFPGIGGKHNGAVVEYAHIAQQPTMLEVVKLDIAQRIEAVFQSRGFPLQFTPNIDGWLAYHAVFISCVSMALLRANGNPVALGNDRALLKHMCQAIEEGFRVLRLQGVQGAPRNLMILHTPIFRPIAIHYWGSLMRSPKGELYFGAHARHASDEIRLLAQWVVARAKAAPTAGHLLGLLGQSDG